MNGLPTEVGTPHGPGRLAWDPAGTPRAVLLLGHGAGGSIEGVDLLALKDHLPGLGISVVRYVQPWKVAGKKVTARPPVLDEGWLPAVDAVRAAVPGVPLFVGGHSAGARVACRTASATGAEGVLALSFPLHPPGHPEKSRAEELRAAGVRTLVLQGSKDTFGGYSEVCDAVAGVRDIELREVPAAGHDLKPAKSAGIATAQWWERAASGVAEWILRRG